MAKLNIEASWVASKRKNINYSSCVLVKHLFLMHKVKIYKYKDLYEK